MEWQIFALLQMALITIGVALAFGLSNRKLSSQNSLLRQHLEQTAADAGKADPEALLASGLSGISDDNPLKPLCAAVLNNASSPADDFPATLQTLISEAGLGETSTLQTKIDELEAALADSTTMDAAGAEPAEAEELKSLLQQFTRDSREMMACIAELEKENAELQTKLASYEPADDPDAEPDPARESLADSETADTAA